MPFITKNLSALITILVLAAGGIASFATLKSDVNALEVRVEKLETSNDDIKETLTRIDKRLAQILCKIDISTCLEK